MPAVVVHDLAQAAAAARAAAAAGARLTIRSTPGMGRSLGVGGWLALVEAAKAAAPTADLAFCLDCAADTGDAQAAIAFGADRIALSTEPAAYARIAAMAAAEGVEIDTAPADLDLAFQHDPEAATRRLIHSNSDA